MLRKESRAYLEDGLRVLTGRERLALLLRDVEACLPRRSPVRLGCSKATVRSHIANARSSSAGTWKGESHEASFRNGTGVVCGPRIGVAARWSLRRHLARCAACRAEVAAFVVSRESLEAAANELPAEVNWNRLAADMKANIHVGLAAGECVGPERPARVRIAWRAAATVAPVAVMVLLGWWLLPSRPGHTDARKRRVSFWRPPPGGLNCGNMAEASLFSILETWM